jgi:hypothetical protein
VVEPGVDGVVFVKVERLLEPLWESVLELLLLLDPEVSVSEPAPP